MSFWHQKAQATVQYRMTCMQIVRTAFNVAIGAESEEIKRTAKNALLQMLNTIVKRVTQYPLVSRILSAS